MKVHRRKILVAGLALLSILFFMPWFASNMGSKVLNTYEIITGPHVSKYALMLGDLAGDELGGGVRLALGAMEYMYVLPILAFLCILVLYADRLLGSIITIFTAAIHTILSAVFLLLPISIRELVDLMFIVTPTIYLYGVVGILCTVSASLYLRDTLTAPEFREGRRNAKRAAAEKKAAATKRAAGAKKAAAERKAAAAKKESAVKKESAEQAFSEKPKPKRKVGVSKSRK